MNTGAQGATTLRAHRFPVSRSVTPAARTRALVPLSAPTVSPTSIGNSSLNDFHRILSPSETGASLAGFPQLGSTVLSGSEFPPALLSATSVSPTLVGHYPPKHRGNQYSQRVSPSGTSLHAAGKGLNASGDGFGMLMTGTGSHGHARRPPYPSSGVVGSRSSPVTSMPGGGVMGFGPAFSGVGGGTSGSFESRGHSPLQSTTEAVVTVVMPIPGASVVRDEQEAMWRAAEEDDNANTDRVQVKVEGFFEQDEICGLIPSEMPRSRVLYVLTASEGRDMIFKTIQYSLLVVICLLKRPYLFSPDAASFLDMWAVRFWNNYNTIRHSRSLFKLGSWILNLFQAQSALERLAVVHKRILLQFLRSFTRVFCLPIANALSIHIPRFYYLAEEEEEEDRRRQKLYNIAFGNTNSSLLLGGTRTSHPSSGHLHANASKKSLDFPERFNSSVFEGSSSEEMKSTTVHESMGLSLSPAENSTLISIAAAKRQAGIDFSEELEEVQEGKNAMHHKCSEKKGEEAGRTGECEGESVDGGRKKRMVVNFPQSLLPPFLREGKSKNTEVEDMLDQDNFFLKRNSSCGLSEWERRRKKSSISEVDDMLLGGVYAHVSEAERPPGTNVGVGKTSNSFLGISDALSSGKEKISTTTASSTFPFLRNSPATPPPELPYSSSPLPVDQFIPSPDGGMQEGSTSMRLKYADLCGNEVKLLSSKVKENPVCIANCKIPSFPGVSLTSYPSKEERSWTNDLGKENGAVSASERSNGGTVTTHESGVIASSEKDVEKEGHVEYSTIVNGIHREKKEGANGVPLSMHSVFSNSADVMNNDRHDATAHPNEPSSLPLSASLCTEFCSNLSDVGVVRVIPPCPPGTASASDASKKDTSRVDGSHPHSLSRVHGLPEVLIDGQGGEGGRIMRFMEGPRSAAEDAENSSTLDYRYDEDSPKFSSNAAGGEGSTTEKVVEMNWIDSSEMDDSNPTNAMKVNANHTEETKASHGTNLPGVIPLVRSIDALTAEGKTAKEGEGLSAGVHEKFHKTEKRGNQIEGKRGALEDSEKSYVTRSPPDRYLEQTLGPNDRRPPTPSPALQNALPSSRDKKVDRHSDSEDSNGDLEVRVKHDDEAEGVKGKKEDQPPSMTKDPWTQEEKQENDAVTNHSQVSNSQRSSDISVEDEDEAFLFYRTEISALSLPHKQESGILDKTIKESPAASSIADPLPPERRPKRRLAPIFSQEFLKAEFSNGENGVPEWPGALSTGAALADCPPYTINPSNGVPNAVVHLPTTDPRVSHDTAPIPLLPTGQKTMNNSMHLHAPTNDGHGPLPGFLSSTKPLDASDVLTPESVTVAVLEASRRSDGPFGVRQNLNDPLKDGGVHGKIFGGGERNGERPSTLPYVHVPSAAAAVPTSGKKNGTTGCPQTTHDASPSSPSHPNTHEQKVELSRGEGTERGARSDDVLATSSRLSVFSSNLSSSTLSSSSSELQRAAIPAATALPSQGRQSPYQFRKPLMVLFLIRSLSAAARRFLRDSTLLSSERFFILKKVERNRRRIHGAINIFWFISATIDLILSTTRVFQKGWLQYASSRQNIYCRCGCKILEDPADFTCRVQGMVVRRKMDLFFPPLDLDYGAPATSNIGFFEAADPLMMRPACTRCGCIYSVPVQRVYTSENPANQAPVEDSDRGKSAAAAEAAAAAVAAAGEECASLTEFPSDMNSTTRRNCVENNSSSTKTVHTYFTSGGGKRSTPTYRSSSVGKMTGMGSSSVLASKLSVKSPLQAPEMLADKPKESAMRRRSSSKAFSHARGDSGASIRKVIHNATTSFSESRSSPLKEMRKFGEEGALPDRTDSSTNGEKDVGLLLVPWVMRRLFNYAWLAVVHENFTGTLLMHLNYMAQWYLAYQYTFGNFESYRRDTPLKDVLHLDGAVAGLLSALVVLLRVIKSAPK